MKIVDMHCDTISEIYKSKGSDNPQGLFENSLHIDIQKMKKSGYLLQNFAMFTNIEEVGDPFEYAMDLIHIFYEEMEHNENDICVIKNYEDIVHNEKHGKMSAMMTIEEGACCKGDIEKLEKLYSLGARMMTLTWNYPNELAFPNIFEKQKNDKGFYLFDSSKGLSKKGFGFIERMEELGIIIDVSHLSDKGFWDIAQNTKKPFVASHSNARTLCGHARNLTDEMIAAIADRGGVIGLNFYGLFLNESADYYSNVKRMAEHARHIINIGGADCLGLGSDFDGIDGVLEMQDCSHMDKLINELQRQHFSNSEIEKIFYKNVLRVYKELL